MGQRSRARELALKCLYAYESTGESIDSICKSLIGDAGLKPDSAKFAETLLRQTVDSLKQLDHHITEHAINWEIERLAVVDKNILRLGICELLFFPDIPAKVAINEAVELAKKYSAEESSGFVNGVLDALNKKLQQASS